MTNLIAGDGEVFLRQGALAPAAADRLFERLKSDISWRQETASIMGRSVALPRLTAWYGDRDYRYSGIDNQPAPWPDILAPLRSNLEEWAGVTFNAVLLNRYRDGRDSISWHSDAEASLGPNPVIASVSLGAPRRFKLKHRRGRFPSVDVDLRHGDVLIMAGASQHHWLHAVPKTAKPVGERLNLTFRRIVVAPSGLRGE